ncbi:MAG: PAS domain-containing protein, partial [Parvibaculum sp.]|nr:PAS domain-containing protein [Parvibaculum sp.]
PRTGRRVRAMGQRAEGSFSSGERARKITEEPQFIDAPEHPSVVALLAYFEDKRGTREMADRADINPPEIARYMPNMIIAEAVNDGEDFRTRLFGTALVELLGEERTGKLLSEFAEEGAIAKDKEAVQRRWLYISRKAYFGRKPVFAKVPFAASGRLYLVGHTISVPLTAGGHGPAQVVGGMFVVRAGEKLL